MSDSRRQRASLSLVTALSAAIACSMPGGGGVSGNVRDESGRPILRAQVKVLSSATILGVPIPFADPEVFTTTTDEEGRFGVNWSHGSEGHLEASDPGRLMAQVPLESGYSTCTFVLVPAGKGSRGASSGHCRSGRAAEQ
jgi:hypothetical protein